MTRLLAALYRVSPGIWLFASGIFVSHGVNVIDDSLLGSSTRARGPEFALGVAYICFAATCAAIGWEFERVSTEVAVLARGSLLASADPVDAVLTSHRKRILRRWTALVASLAGIVVITLLPASRGNTQAPSPGSDPRPTTTSSTQAPSPTPRQLP
jgi:hypothetical protein